MPDLTARIPLERLRARNNFAPELVPMSVKKAFGLLPEIGRSRLADMDSAGITVQVLSLAGPGSELLNGTDATTWAREINDRLATAISEHPDRLAGFAHLPLSEPTEAADELQRCVKELGFVGALISGGLSGCFLDDPVFQPLLARAEKLDVPLYLHPNAPPEAVCEAYYRGLPGSFGYILSTFGFGWHAEVAIHVLRMIFSGTMEKYRGLKLIIGHMGEFLPMTIARTTALSAREVAKSMSRDVGEQLREQVWITTSGMFTSPPLQAVIDTFSIDHVMFGVDYPFSSNQEGRAFLDSLALPQGDLEKLAFANADRLLKLGGHPHRPHSLLHSQRHRPRAPTGPKFHL